LVRPELAGDGAARPTRLEAVNRGWVSITRPWHLVSQSTGLGDPSAASADKGRRLMDVLVERLGGVLGALAAAEMDAEVPDRAACGGGGGAPPRRLGSEGRRAEPPPTSSKQAGRVRWAMPLVRLGPCGWGRPGGILPHVPPGWQNGALA